MNVPYITLLNLAERPGLVEISQVVAQDGESPVSSDLLTAIIQEQNTSTWSQDDVADANTALSRVTESIDDTQAEIDGYLRQRGHKLPLKVVPRQLTNWARAIVRYKLHRNLIAEEKTDPIVRDYKIAIDYLKQIALGKYSLGIEDALPVAGGVPKQTGPVRVFDMNTLRDYGK